MHDNGWKNEVDALTLGLRGKILRFGAVTDKIDCFYSPASNLDSRVRGVGRPAFAGWTIEHPG